MSAFFRKDFDKVEKIRKLYPHLKIFEKFDKYKEINKKPNGETFEASWKAVTITYKHHETKPITLEFIEDRVNRFLDHRFNRWIYTVEKISTNIHIHLCFEFVRKKLRKDILIHQIYKIFEKDLFDIALFDNCKKCHLRSKTLPQVAGFIGYIQKEQEDKVVRVCPCVEFHKIASSYIN